MRPDLAVGILLLVNGLAVLLYARIKPEKLIGLNQKQATWLSLVPLAAGAMIIVLWLLEKHS